MKIRDILLVITGIVLKICVILYACKSNYVAGLFFAAEITVICASMYFFKRRWRPFYIPLILIILLQLINFAGTGNLLDSETLQNMNEGGALDSSFIIRLAVFSAVAVVAMIPEFLVPRISKSDNCKSRRITLHYITLLLCFGVIECFPKAPIHAFFDTVYSVVDLMFFAQPDINSGSMFCRERIEDSGISKKIGTENKNVILIFAEGTSSHCLSPELTPNVMNLKKESIYFENYFSHTASTFRGIRGQMISGFPLLGGADSYELIKKYYSGQFPSLPEMLNRHGYKTVFVSPHAQKENLGNVMGLLGFKNLKHSHDYKDSENLTDREQYQHLWQILENLSKSKEKFFLATYVLGTHHGMDSPDKKFADGKNSYLNKFHNQDYWFGEFLKKFKSSGLAENTILIWTSDHSTYPTDEYNNTFKRKEEHFVGKVPLLIYNNGKNAKLIDAKIRNSLSLAPTILDMLNIHEEKNYFLGNSLFIDKKNEWDNIAVIGTRRVFYVKENGEVCFLKEISRLKNRILRNRMSEYYKFIQ